LIKAELNARVLCERFVYLMLLGTALISILTTVGIALSVVFEAARFFRQVSFIEFITGTTWAPGGAFLESAGRGGEQGTESEFGAVPLFAGTLMISAIAMLVAVPLGLLAAIYLAEYASRKARRLLKPMLEILAGIPTVVYGFFAAITVAPLIVNFFTRLGLETSFENALAPGVVMGVMIIPFMSSLCDDVITSVPQNIRQAALSLGATKSEMIKGTVLPAALPGIVSAFLLSASRAIGETMIVVMAAGMAANLTPIPLEQMTTVTVHIVANLTGDLAYDNPQTLSAFGLGLSLLVVTLILNIVSVIIIRRFRQRYEAD
jgi:phosphate transport system permease protein